MTIREDIIGLSGASSINSRATRDRKIYQRSWQILPAGCSMHGDNRSADRFVAGDGLGGRLGDGFGLFVLPRHGQELLGGV